MGYSVSLACERLGVRIPAATDISRKNRWRQLDCQTLGNRCECRGFYTITIINECPLSQYSTDQTKPNRKRTQTRPQVRFKGPVGVRFKSGTRADPDRTQIKPREHLERTQSEPRKRTPISEANPENGPGVRFT